MSGFPMPMADQDIDNYSLTNNTFFQAASSRGYSAYNVPAVGSRSRNIPVSEAEAKAAMQSILDIFDLDEELPGQPRENEQDDDDTELPIDLEDQNRRTERLRSVYPALDQLWWTGSDYMTGAAEKLADGCRDRKSSPIMFWRIKLVIPNSLPAQPVGPLICNVKMLCSCIWADTSSFL
jgi:hypothetical protein